MASLDAIGLVTANLAESCRFYRTLGLDVPEPPPDEPHGHFEVTLPSGVRLMWDTEDSIREIFPDWKTPVGQRIGLAFGCGSPAEVDATYGRLLEAGFTGAKEPWDAFWGQRYAQVYDPDGSKVDLFAPL
jgi:catechol 2,3-dioxygenase-like lactoylglutathione lyase family enzyme